MQICIPKLLSVSPFSRFAPLSSFLVGSNVADIGLILPIDKIGDKAAESSCVLPYSCSVWQ